MLRRNFNASTIIAIVALVFAMTGGAYAAKHYLITSTKQISPKVLKALKGKAGPRGAAGSAGPAGPQGPAGAAGKNGTSGKDGTNGTNGAPGEAAKVEAIAKTSSECNKEGGVKVSNANGSGTACNGKTGFTEYLPEGKTERGVWSLSQTTKGGEVYTSSVSFPIALEAAPVKHYLREDGKEAIWNATTGKAEEVTSTACTGSAAAPTATPGNLCVYAAAEEDTYKEYSVPLPDPCFLDHQAPAGKGCLYNAASSDVVSPFGFGITTISESEGALNVFGTWAVTAE